jgi:phosphoglycolate phosphatase
VRPVRLVVFDLDGTLVDSVADLRSAANRMLHVVDPGAAPLSMDEVRSFVGDGARELVLRVLARSRVEADPDGALATFLGFYETGLLDATRPYPGVVTGLDRLRDRTLAVLTNKPGNMSRTILEGLGLADRFFRVYGGGDVSGRKPDPGGLLRILAEARATPGEALMVGDSAVDVRTARNAGTPIAGVTYGLDPTGLRAAAPDLLVGSLEELADRLGARHL